MKKTLNLIFSIFLFASFVQAQTAEVTVSLNEQFFNALLEAIFKNLSVPEFPLAENGSKFRVQSSKLAIHGFSESNAPIQNPKSKIQNCKETIRLQREIDGVRTAVRFRDGKINAPIAFTGSYNPPLIGCISFQGWAETNINLMENRPTQISVLPVTDEQGICIGLLRLHDIVRSGL